MPLISVVIPVHNGEGTLRETLDSVLCQSHADLEVLVIDDDSTDGTAEIVASIPDPRLRLHRIAAHSCAASRNEGIFRARGEYLSFVDADDLWTHDKLEAQLAALLASPPAQVAYSFTTHIGEDGTKRFEGYRGGESRDVLRALFRRYFLESGSNALIHRDVATVVGGFDPEHEICADWDFFLRAAERFEFACVPRSQILYRHRDTALSASGAPLRHDAHEVIRRAVHRSPQLRDLAAEARAIVDNHVLGKTLQGRRDARSVALVLACLGSHLRAGRTGWRLLEARPAVAGYWLTEVLGWLVLPHTLHLRRRRARLRRLAVG